MENPQILRKKLTAFYIQFYLGLFLYLTLTYFFTNDEWFILVRNLLLLPQIVHNTRLGSNPGFHIHYIFGFIGTRLLLPIYERTCPENRFRLSPNFEIVVVLLSLYLLQVSHSNLGSSTTTTIQTRLTLLRPQTFPAQLLQLSSQTENGLNESRR